MTSASPMAIIPIMGEKLRPNVESEPERGWELKWDRHQLEIKHFGIGTISHSTTFADYRPSVREDTKVNIFISPDDKKLEVRPFNAKIYEKDIFFMASDEITVKKLTLGVVNSEYISLIEMWLLPDSSAEPLSFYRFNNDGSLSEVNTYPWSNEVLFSEEIQNHFGELKDVLGPVAALSLKHSFGKILLRYKTTSK